MKILFRFVVELIAVVLAANCVTSTPSCQDCTLLSEEDNDTCNNFDPIVCTSDRLGSSGTGSECNKEYCGLPDAQNSSHAPPIGLQYKLLNYGNGYGLYLWWPEMLDQLPVDYYYVVIRKSQDVSEPPSEYCSPNSGSSPICITLDNSVREYSWHDWYPQSDGVAWLAQVAAIPHFVWTVTIKIPYTGKNCLKGCGECSCDPPHAPTNLTWSRSKDDSGSVCLSWDSDHDSSSVYYLHLNSSTSGKLLYSVKEKTSVIMKNLSGNVTVWLESYNYCGCSKNISEQIHFLIDDSTVSSSQQSHDPTSIISISSSMTVSSVVHTSSNPPTLTTPIVVPLSVVGVILFLVMVSMVVLIIGFQLRRGQYIDFCKPKLVKGLPVVTQHCPELEKVHIDRKCNGVDGNEGQPASTFPYVLLIFSQNTPHSHQDLIRAFGQKLNRNIRVKMYDVAERATRTAWLEGNYRSAAAILCICNKAFTAEWNNSSTPADGSIVSAVKMIVQGQIEHQKQPEKFAILFLCDEDRELTPPYLENVKSFKFSLENIDNVARFALQVEEHKY